jgi:hypothetical protein
MAPEKMRSEFEAEVRVEQELKYLAGKEGTQPIAVKNLTPNIDKLVNVELNCWE